MSEPKSNLELFFEGLFAVRSPLRSRFPEGTPRHKAEQAVADLVFMLRGLPVTIELEIVAGLWWLVVSHKEAPPKRRYDA